MSVYYPSMVFHFKLRFDPSFHVDETPDAVSTTDLTTGRARTSQTQAAQRATIRPLLLEGARDQDTIVANRIPKSADVELPGFRQAGTFKATFDWRDLPIDPRLVRACGVDVHVGAVDPLDFATGMVRVEADGSRRSVLTSSAANQVLAGIVDGWSVTHGERGSEIAIEGRDLRGVLLDSPLDPKIVEKLNLEEDIVGVVQQIVQLHPLGRKVKVVVNKDDWPTEPGGFSRLPSPGTKDKLTRVRQGAKGDKARSNPQGGSDQLNFWDLITRYCFLVGAVPYFRGLDLEIRPARSIYDQAKAGTDPQIKTPFKGGAQREVSVGDPARKERFSVRRFVYGRDVAQLTFERKFTGVKSRVVECVSIDSSRGRGAQKVLVAQWPTQEALKRLEHKPPTVGRQAVFDDAFKRALASVKRARTTSVAPSGKLSEEEKLRIPVPGVSDPARLLEIAKNLFEEIGRGEMGGSVQTANLASFGGDGADPDALRLRPGDGVELLVDARPLSSRAPLASTVVDAQRRSFAEQVAEVRARFGEGGAISPDLARVVVATARGGIVELQRFFRVSNVKYGWQAGRVSVAFDFQNYVEARSRVTLPEASGSSAPTKRVAT